MWDRCAVRIVRGRQIGRIGTRFGQFDPAYWRPLGETQRHGEADSNVGRAFMRIVEVRSPHGIQQWTLLSLSNSGGDRSSRFEFGFLAFRFW